MREPDKGPVDNAAITVRPRWRPVASEPIGVARAAAFSIGTVVIGAVVAEMGVRVFTLINCTGWFRV